LFKIGLEVPVLALGRTPYGQRRIACFAGETFEGPRLQGTVLRAAPVGCSYGMTACSISEVRIVLEADDRQTVYMRWRGLRHGPRSLIDSIAAKLSTHPATIFRTTPYFEIGSEKYSWLNRICSIATGSRIGDRRGFDVNQVL
jgi:hypothetical protein